MSYLCVAPIVEGHGEVQAIRTLLQRIWVEIADGEHVEVLRPIRVPRSRLAKELERQNAVKLAAMKLRETAPPGSPTLILIVADRDPDLRPVCVLGPEWLNSAKTGRSHLDIACVLADVEYETWFVAAAESLASDLNLPSGEAVPATPETSRLGKSWIQSRFKRGRYSETVDQPAMTAKMDLQLCRSRSPSFDKLCRELEKRIVRSGPTAE